MRYQARGPCGPLEPFVKCLWRLRGAASEVGPQPIVPDGCFELIVHLGEPFVEEGVYAATPSTTPSAAPGPALAEPRHDGNARPKETVTTVAGASQDRLLLAATLTRIVVVAAAGEVDVVGVRFRPGGAYPFLAVPPAQVVDTVAPAIDVVPRDLAAQLGRLEPAPTGELFTRIERALLARFDRAGSDPRFDRWVAGLVSPEAGPVAALAAAAGTSQRQLERQFKARAGVSAKVLQRVVRFHRVVTQLLDGSPDLALLALDAGFFDQAHMSHEFRALAATTPRRYLESAGRLDRLFADR